MNCPTCSQPVPRDAEGLVQARVATRIHAERAARKTAQVLVTVVQSGVTGNVHWEEVEIRQGVNSP